MANNSNTTTNTTTQTQQQQSTSMFLPVLCMVAPLYYSASILAGETLKCSDNLRGHLNKKLQEVFIETRQQRYGNLATKREAFYSNTELARFKRAWVWHIRMSEWPTNGLMRCGCPRCDNIDDEHEEEERVLPAPVGLTDIVPANDTRLSQDYSKWTWG